MIIEKHIKQIENLLNKEKIIKYEILQISFDVACVKFELSNKKKYIAKFGVNINKFFNPIKSEAKNIIYLNNLFNFFPKLINWNNKYLIIEYLANDKNIPTETKSDFLKSVVAIHSVSNNLFGKHVLAIVPVTFSPQRAQMLIQPAIYRPRCSVDGAL